MREEREQRCGRVVREMELENHVWKGDHFPASLDID